MARSCCGSCSAATRVQPSPDTLPGPRGNDRTFQTIDLRVTQTDWHDLEEQRFAHDVAAALEKVVRERGVEQLIVVAPPRTLAELRKSFHSDVQKRIVAEIDKDLTKEPIGEIEKHLAA